MRFLLPLLLLTGCPRSSETVEVPESVPAAAPETAPAAKPELAPPAPAAAVPGFDCLKDCMQRHMAEARSAESIEADCLAECGTGTPPDVTDAKSLPLMMGKRVRITGEMKRMPLPGGREGEGTAVMLGAAPVWLTDGEPPHGWQYFLGQKIIVVGTLKQFPGAQRANVPWLSDLDAPLPADAPL